MEDIRRGDIYYIDKNPYRPTHGSVQQPGRPAIIVSNDINNRKSLTFEVVYLTTAPKKKLPTHCAINAIRQPSIALCEQITTVSNEQIRDYQGTCTEEEMRAVEACMAISLGLNSYSEDIEEQRAPEVLSVEEGMKIAEIERLRNDLIRAEKEAEVYRTMYDNLLEKMLG